jgi:hypothetical protein
MRRIMRLPRATAVCFPSIFASRCDALHTEAIHALEVTHSDVATCTLARFPLEASEGNRMSEETH